MKKILCSLMVLFIFITVFGMESTEQLLKNNPKYAADHPQQLQSYLNDNGMDIKIRGKVSKYDVQTNMLSLKDGSSYDIKSLSKKFNLEVDKEGVLQFKEKNNNEGFTLKGTDIMVDGNEIVGTFSNINGVKINNAKGRLSVFNGRVRAQFNEPVTVLSVESPHATLEGDIKLNLGGNKAYEVKGTVIIDEGKVYAKRDSIVNGAKLLSTSRLAYIESEPSYSNTIEVTKVYNSGIAFEPGNTRIRNEERTTITTPNAATISTTPRDKWQKLLDIQNDINSEYRNNGASSRFGELASLRDTYKENELGITGSISTSEIKRRLNAAKISMNNGKVSTGDLRVTIGPETRVDRISLHKKQRFQREQNIEINTGKSNTDATIDENGVTSGNGRVRVKNVPRLDSFTSPPIGESNKKVIPGFPLKDEFHMNEASGYRARREGGSRTHNGNDYYAPTGTPAFSLESGTVEYAGDLGGRPGITVIVSGYDQLIGQYYRHSYVHLDRVAVKKGDKISPDKVVGYVGNTGNAKDGPSHLHFVVRTGNNPNQITDMDPLEYFRNRYQSGQRMIAD